MLSSIGNKIVSLNLLIVGVLFILPQWTSAITLVDQDQNAGAEATNADWKNIVDLSRSAELVFRGTVLAVGYRNSEPPMVFPHTFVRFHVDDVLKGKDPGSTLTLRFAGGWHGGGSEMSFLADHTLFDPGDQDILFVANNLTRACPLVNCEGGRIRLIDGLVYAETGRELGRVGPRFVPGKRRDDLPSVMTNQVGPFKLGVVRDSAEGEREAGPILPAGWEQWSAPAFVAQLTELIENNHTAAELEALPTVPSASPQEAFAVPLPKAVPFTEVKKGTIPPVEEEQ